ncbi:NAD-dependent epimerase/dehydratase family protein [Azospirillum sp. ST 5-10]|uniref:NAD-dependent epimerase/dehydratase family protein n=1 Tax=unclassified Azospirillum TaxID=2630922 RepID=UPI003F4A75D2
MRVVVTGAHGFIGRRVSPELRRRGHEVLSLGFRVGAPAPRPAERYDGRLSSADAVDELVALLMEWQPDAVLHLAGTTNADHPDTLFALNAGFASTLMAAMRGAGFSDRPVLLMGSAAEYGPFPRRLQPLDETARTEPTGLYGLSKLAQTRAGLAASELGQAVIVARVFNAIGTGMPAHLSLPSFARRLAASARPGDGPLATGNLNAVRDFVPVQSIATALADLLQCPAARGRVVNVCSGHPYRVGDVLARMIRLAGSVVAVDQAQTAAGFTDVAFGDPSLLARLTGWQPPRLRNADLREILEEAGCPVRDKDGERTVPIVGPIERADER